MKQQRAIIAFSQRIGVKELCAESCAITKRTLPATPRRRPANGISHHGENRNKLAAKQYKSVVEAKTMLALTNDLFWNCSWITWRIPLNAVFWFDGKSTCVTIASLCLGQDVVYGIGYSGWSGKVPCLQMGRQERRVGTAHLRRVGTAHSKLGFRPFGRLYCSRCFWNDWDNRFTLFSLLTWFFYQHQILSPEWKSRQQCF